MDAPHRLLLSRGLRGAADGAMAVLLPAWLTTLGYGAAQVGLVGSLTMAGSAAATLALGAWGHRWPHAQLLRAAALLMAATGAGFAAGRPDAFWPLALVAFFGTLNPSSGDVSVFQPLEHAQLAQDVTGGTGGAAARTRRFARYALTGSLAGAVGALAAGLPGWWAAQGWASGPATLRASFIAYGLTGLAVAWLYRGLPDAQADSGSDTHARTPEQPVTQAPLGASRRIVVHLAALFSVDSFAGGLVVNSLLALWLFQRFGLTVAQAGQFFFVTGLLATASLLLAPWLARRIGLVRTMVFTHLPANLCLVAAAFAPSLPVALGLLFVRSALSSMDVPARSAFVMAVVTPPERAAAASFTAVPRSLAAALGPSIAGALLAGGWLATPLVAGGLLKAAYDLALLRAFHDHPVE